MCWLIFVGISNYSGDVAASFVDQGLVPASTANPVMSVMPANATKLAISDGHCACSIYPDNGRVTKETAEGLRERYQRKGWTHSKIERAVQARLDANERNSQKRDADNGFVTAVSALAASGAQVSLLAHFFDSSFEKPFEISHRERLALADFIANSGAFAEDTLVTLER